MSFSKNLHLHEFIWRLHWLQSGISISAIISTRIRFQSFPLNFLLFPQTKIANQAKINIISTNTYITHLD